jgi:hypothetical protein
MSHEGFAYNSIIKNKYCNPSYLGGWNQEDCSLRPAQAKSFQDPISTNSWAQWHAPVIPNYIRGWDGFEVSPGEKSWETPSQCKNVGHGAVIPAMAESLK